MIRSHLKLTDRYAAEYSASGHTASPSLGDSASQNVETSQKAETHRKDFILVRLWWIANNNHPSGRSPYPITMNHDTSEDKVEYSTWHIAHDNRYKHGPPQIEDSRRSIKRVCEIVNDSGPDRLPELTASALRNLCKTKPAYWNSRTKEKQTFESVCKNRTSKKVQITRMPPCYHKNKKQE